MQDVTQAVGVRPVKHPRKTFALAMLVYLLVVHGASINLYPVGRDYAAMAEPARLGGWAATLFAWEVRLFQDNPVPYRLVNLVCLYGIMLAMFFYVRHTARGPWWLGSLAATLLMAHPVKSEAVLYLSGVRELIPALLLLSSLAVYAADVRVCRLWKYLIALGLGAAAMFANIGNVCLALIVLLHEALIATPEERNWRRPLPFLALAVLCAVLDFEGWRALLVEHRVLFPPLHFVVYPIGLLPETVTFFKDHPLLHALSISTEVACFAWIAWKVRHPTLTLGLLAAVIAGYAWCRLPVDPVELTGGGQLLLSAAFLSVALAGFCAAVWRHPKWRRPLVLLTSLLCVLFFALQIREILAWRELSQATRALHERFERGDRVITYPADLDIASLDDAIRYHTPFSKGWLRPEASPGANASRADGVLP